MQQRKVVVALGVITALILVFTKSGSDFEWSTTPIPATEGTGRDNDHSESNSRYRSQEDAREKKSRFPAPARSTATAATSLAATPSNVDEIRAELGPNDFEEWIAKRDGMVATRRDEYERIPKRTFEEIREGSGVAFRKDLEWTDEDRATDRAHAAALHAGTDAYFKMLADTPTPLKPWKKVAKPIVCHGLEYYSGHFSIPSKNVVPALPTKTQDWATVVPGRKETYLFKVETLYQKDLEVSRFGITRRRYGFATNRNLEMLAAGCVPYFCGIHRVPKEGTLDSLPKEFFEMILKFPGVTAKCFPPRRAAGFPLLRDGSAAAFNETRYTRVATKLLDYTRKYQTTSHFAKYVLSATSLKTLPRSVLIIWASHYTIMLTGFLHGLRELGVRVEDVPRRAELYDDVDCPKAQRKTYAKGWFFFCRAPESQGLPRKNIEARIRAREFDLIVISVTDTLTYHIKDPNYDIPFFEAVSQSYPKDLVLAMNDADLVKPMTADVAHKVLYNHTTYFKRETHGCRESIW